MIYKSIVNYSNINFLPTSTYIMRCPDFMQIKLILSTLSRIICDQKRCFN